MLIQINLFLWKYSLYKVLKMNFKHQFMNLSYVMIIITFEPKVLF